MGNLIKRETLPAHISEIWEEVEGSVRAQIGEAGMESLCSQIHRMREARTRIDEEGIVVQDSKGNPTPHPALDIERRAQTEIRAWMKDFKVMKR